MDIKAAIILVIVLLVVVAVGAWLLQRKRTSDRLRNRFGPEYAKTIEATSTKREAEAELLGRAKRVDAFKLKALTPGEREHFTDAWRTVQADFIDNPKSAVARADLLLGEVMETRGYAVADFEQRSADLSVDHPVVVQNYRAAHDIAIRHGRGEAGTEDLRQAMIYYRALFDDLTVEAAPVVAKARVE